jgi:hypothetical protein
MAAVNMNTKIAHRIKRATHPPLYYSVEFCVGSPQPLYQFKIWRSESNPMFVVVKNNSDVLPKLKPGSVLKMTYYSCDTRRPTTQIETRIGPISNAFKGRFEGHCTIDLVPVEDASLQN